MNDFEKTIYGRIDGVITNLYTILYATDEVGESRFVLQSIITLRELQVMMLRYHSDIR